MNNPMRDPSEVIAAVVACHRTVTPNGAWQWMDGPPSLGALDNLKVHPAWRIEYAYTTPQPASADVDDGLDEIAHTLESWTRAYPIDIFSEPTKEDLDWLHATRPGLCDRISASMGRHMVKHMADMAAQVRKLVKGDSHAG